MGKCAPRRLQHINHKVTSPLVMPDLIGTEVVEVDSCSLLEAEIEAGGDVAAADDVGGRPARLSKKEKKELNYLKRKAAFKEKTLAKKALRRDVLAVAAEAASGVTAVREHNGINTLQNISTDNTDVNICIANNINIPAKAKRVDERMVYMWSQLEHTDSVKVCVDLGFLDTQTTPSRNSVYKQTSLSYAAIKRAQAPVALHLVSLNGDTATGMGFQGVEHWAAHRHEGNLLDVFKPSDVIYLSPDATETLHTLDSGKVYVVGGIADRTVQKNMTLTRAAEMQVATRRLPIEEYIPDRRTHVLNIDTVVAILAAFAKTQDWKSALDESVPLRQLGQGGKKKRKLQQQQLLGEGVADKN